MAKVEWVKIYTDMFDNKKIKWKIIKLMKIYLIKYTIKIINDKDEGLDENLYTWTTLKVSVTITEKENQSQENGDEAAEEEPEEETSELNGGE